MHLPKSPWFRWGVSLGIGFLLVIGIGRQFRSAEKLATLEPLPQDPSIQAYFNHSQAAYYTDPYRQITRHGDNLEQIIIEAIESAQSSIDVAVHEFTLPGIAQALGQKQTQGVHVRVVVENTYNIPITQKDPEQFDRLADYDRNKVVDLYRFVDQNQDGELSPKEIAARDALTILEQAQVPRLDDTADGSKGSGLMHHKFMVVDGHTVITGSANWTLSDIHGDFLSPSSQGNANSLLVITSAPLAQHFQAEFNTLWGDGPQGQTDSQFGLQKAHRPAQSAAIAGTVVELQFSPTSETRPWAESVNGLIAKTLGQASQGVDLALFVFSDQTLSHHLAQEARQGVTVRALIDPGFAYRSYSTGLDMLGLAVPDHRCKFSPNNQPWTQPITSVGVPALAEGDKLHHKFAVIDNSIVVVGSQNWSQAANTSNDENLLVIHSAIVAAHYQREFERLYTGATLGITPQLQGIIAKQRSRCGL
ncbi:MAG: competence protein ComE [Leptolyngbyaceae cyanobacterium SM2_5_2]|nr:competence protein ComE [Leptolyngbyaceae cyanobacterium SM2_5_2]